MTQPDVTITKPGQSSVVDLPSLVLHPSDPDEGQVSLPSSVTTCCCHSAAEVVESATFDDDVRRRFERQ